MLQTGFEPTDFGQGLRRASNGLWVWMSLRLDSGTGKTRTDDHESTVFCASLMD